MSIAQNGVVVKERNSSIEFLRIVAMFFIVFSHSSVHGGFPKTDSAFGLNRFLLDWLVLGNLGVDIFVLISGYFLSDKPFKIGSLFRLLSQVWFYSILGCILGVLIGVKPSGADFLKVIFPTIFKEYWFFTAYFVLTLLSPFINSFIKNATKKQLSSCLIIMLVLWCVIFNFTNQDMFCSTLPQFVMFYLLGAYFKKYPEHILSVPRVRYSLALVSFFLLLASCSAIRIVNRVVGTSISETSFHNPLSILTVGSAIGFFSIAIYNKPSKNKFINGIASCTFGVYLLHDNPFVREILWKKWINNSAYYNSSYLFARIIISVILVFSVCCVIEYIRQKTIAQRFAALTENIFCNFCGLFKKIPNDNTQAK